MGALLTAREHVVVAHLARDEQVHGADLLKEGATGPGANRHA